jgi:hypothetical protein
MRKEAWSPWPVVCHRELDKDRRAAAPVHLAGCELGRLTPDGGDPAVPGPVPGVYLVVRRRLSAHTVRPSRNGSRASSAKRRVTVAPTWFGARVACPMALIFEGRPTMLWPASRRLPPPLG